MIDLHVHSTASDGTLSPADVVRHAAEKNLSAIALTDHDTISGLREAVSASRSCGVEVIPGIEMSCIWKDAEIHMLGYFTDPDDAGFREDLGFFISKRDERNDILLDNLAEDGIRLTREELQFGSPDTVITRAHFARLLVEKGYARDMKDAFTKYLTYGGRYCPRKKGISPEDVLGMFLKHKVWPSLAHPYQYGLSNAGLQELITTLCAGGLRGIEVWHSSHHYADSSRLLAIARVNRLIPTGGTDFHGANKPDIEIGVGYGGMSIPDSVLRDIRKDYEELRCRT